MRVQYHYRIFVKHVVSIYSFNTRVKSRFDSQKMMSRLSPRWLANQVVLELALGDLEGELINRREGRLLHRHVDVLEIEGAFRQDQLIVD